MDSSNLVIKVKYGETLRRFNARIVDEKLCLNIIEMREKVFSLFNFPTDSEVTLTYIDEDGDAVTLADDDDLYDIMRQSLNPLRIIVSSNKEISVRRSGNSTPMKSFRGQTQSLFDDVGVSDFVKSLLAVVHEKLSTQSLGLGTDAKSILLEYIALLDSLLKMSLDYRKDSVPHTESGPSESNLDETLTKEKNCLRADAIPPAAELKCNEAERDLTKFAAGSVMCKTALSNGLNVDKLSIGSSSENPSPFSFVASVDNTENQAKKIRESNERGWYSEGFVQGKRASTNGPGDKTKEIRKENESSQGCNSVGLSTSNSMNPFLASAAGGSIESKVAVESGNTLWSQFGIKSVGTRLNTNRNSLKQIKKGFPQVFGRYPFTGVPNENYSSSVPLRHYAPLLAPNKKSDTPSDGIGTIFHRGVRCDGCGVHPITGPRFKSKVKGDYDLCSISFAEMGNEADYVKMDRPTSYRHPVCLNSLCDPVQSYLVRPSPLPQVSGSSVNRSKLDSRFIVDVNTIDGTIMAPSTTFTKIWRLRNNGTAVWPQGTQLLWIGGDKFSKTLSVCLQIPGSGCPVDGEIDVAVDFSAPENPGRFISYWRLASPSGQKFGQRVWVLIQVDAALKASCSKIVHGFNLNLPPVSSGMMSSQIEIAGAEPTTEDGLPKPENFNSVAELVEPVVHAPSNNTQGHNFHANDTLVRGNVPNPASIDASTLPACPTVDFSKVKPVATSSAHNSDMDVPSIMVGVGGKDEVELTLQKELEEMGFKQIDLNKEILRMNEYSLEQSVADLCGDEEWDPMLKELQEMGFLDKEMNKMLLKKNNGSIKRAVMDLIAGEG